MSGLCDLAELADLPKAERIALCAELDQLNRVFSLSPAPATTDASQSGRTPAATGAGDSFPEQGARA